MGTVADNLKTVASSVPDGVKLVVVSKYRPVEQLEECYKAGARIFAESRPLEFSLKVKTLPGDIEWHFIGHLQTNKLGYVLPYASLVHSVDSEHLLSAIDNFACRSGRIIDVLLEVHIGREESKNGFFPEQIPSLLERIAAKGLYPNVRIRGLMGMASNTSDESITDAEFSRIENLFNLVRSSLFCPEGFKELSIGMSGDYKLALRHGATMVRIGSAIFDLEAV